MVSAAHAQDTRPEPMVPDGDGNYLPNIAKDVPLDEDALIAAFSDKTHRGTYSFKRPNIDTFAFVETTTSDGRTVHKHGEATDTGTWRVRANVICFTYENWDSIGRETMHCFNIYQRGNCYYHYGLGAGGSFTARSVHDGETPDCEPAFV